MTLQTHSGENKVLCEILYFGSQGTLLLVLSSCSLNLPLNQGEHGTWSCFSEHKKHQQHHNSTLQTFRVIAKFKLNVTQCGLE